LFHVGRSVDEEKRLLVGAVLDCLFVGVDRIPILEDPVFDRLGLVLVSHVLESVVTPGLLVAHIRYIRRRD
jgi:hypothetical protein